MQLIWPAIDGKQNLIFGGTFARISDFYSKLALNLRRGSMVQNNSRMALANVTGLPLLFAAMIPYATCPGLSKLLDEAKVSQSWIRASCNQIFHV
jgi:hypothetical protein